MGINGAIESQSGNGSRHGTARLTLISQNAESRSPADDIVLTSV